MPPVLKVNGRDLSAYVRVAHDEGLEPTDPDRFEPQWSGSAAFRDGMEWVKDSAGNNEMVFPLIVNLPTTAALHELLRDIRTDLFRGAQIEFAVDSSEPSTFWDLERGRLEEQFQYWLARKGKLRCVLRLWTRPHGNTGTARTVASFAGTGPQSFPATGLVGDARALGKLEVRVGSKVASAGRVVAYGVHSHPSFNGIHTASNGLLEGQASSAVTGASGAMASRFLAVPVSPTGASGVALRDYLSPPAAHVGRHRVIGVLNSGLNQPITLWARDRWGAPLGPTRQATQTDVTKWQLVDLGEIQVPGRASGQEAVPTQFVEVIGGGASGAGINASPALRVAGLMYLPIDESVGVLRTSGNTGNALRYFDSFTRIASNEFLHNEPNLEVGDTAWTRLGGFLGQANSAGHGGAQVAPVGSHYDGSKNLVPTAMNGATALFALASGAKLTDTQIEGNFQLQSFVASSLASGFAGELWAKTRTNASAIELGVGAHLEWMGGSPAVSLVVASGGATAGIASAVVASALGVVSGMLQAQVVRMSLRVNGPRIDLWLGTAITGSPLLTASHALGPIEGWPALRMRAGGNTATGAHIFDSLIVYDLGEAIPDIAARSHFRFESHPAERAYRGNASLFEADHAADFVGEPPKLPWAGTPAASGPARVIVFEGEPDNFLGNDLIDVRLDVVEQFTFAR
jgi:hypothetical protein